MPLMGKAVIEMEPDSQYTLLIYTTTEAAGEELQTATANLTLAAAFNSARDALAAMATGGEKHRRVTVSTRIA